MKKILSLVDETGKVIAVSMDNWGSGTDKSFRRWVREAEGWRCVETGLLARPAKRFATLFRKSARPAFN